MISLKTNNAFTLLEIIVVIIIVGVIASLALPRMGHTIERSKVSEALQILSSIRSAQIVYEFENAGYAADIDDLDITIPALTHFEVPVLSAADPIGSIERDTTNYEYRLGILIDGSLCCDGDGAATIPAAACDILGYSTACP
ncbi:MAG: type IV pilus assembly protein PilA [Lysobacterales bacterium]|jgi:type IV pilus assembly protein PilA